MSEEKNDLGGATARIPDWLADELEAEIRKHPRRKRPTRGKLLANAWTVAKQSEGKSQSADYPISSVDSLKKNKNADNNSVASAICLTDNCEVRGTFTQWVRRLVYILSANYPPAAEPLKQNLEGFCVLTDLAIEVGEIERPSSPYPHPAEGKAHHSKLRVEEIRKRLQSAAELRARVEQSLADDEQAPEKSPERKKKDDGKTGSGS
jgi:hypothetical protein